MGITTGMPKPGKAVAWLLIANLVIFVLEHILPDSFMSFLAVIPSLWWEVWRYVTFQFLHAGIFHILLNMIGLYFLGMYLERAWGTKRFLVFYLICGAVAGLTHVALSYIFGQDLGIPLIGASGGVYAVIMACAILFPNIRLILVFFPVPIRFAVLLFFVIAFFSLFSGGGGGISHAAHFGGMVAAGVWIWALPKVRRVGEDAREKANQGTWERKIRKQQAEQAQIDFILDKIRRKGIGSLTGKEKRILRDATERQRREDQRIKRM